MKKHEEWTVFDFLSLATFMIFLWQSFNIVTSTSIHQIYKEVLLIKYVLWIIAFQVMKIAVKE